MKNFRQKAVLFFVLSMLITGFLAQAAEKPFVSGYYIAPNHYLTPDLETQLVNKLKAVFSRYNIMLSGGACPIVTIISYQESEVITIEGTRRAYKCLGILSCSVVSVYDTSLLAVVALDIEGVGTSPDIGRANSFRNIQFPQNKMLPAIDMIRQNAQIALDKHSTKIFDRARLLRVNQNYIDAIAATALIPEEYSFYNKIIVFNRECDSLQLLLIKKQEEEKRRQEEIVLQRERDSLAFEKHKFDKKTELEKHKYDKKTELEKQKSEAENRRAEAETAEREKTRRKELDVDAVKAQYRAQVETARQENIRRADSEYRQIIQYFIKSR